MNGSFVKRRRKASRRQTPRATIGDGAASCNPPQKNEIGGRGGAKLVSRKTQARSKLNQRRHQAFIYPPPPRYFTPWQRKKEERGRKIHRNHCSPSAHSNFTFFSPPLFFFTFQVKGCASFILQRHANFSVSTSPSFQ